ncbi:MAG: helix-turn-helix domain-containing protein [Leptospiraceae bacterium]|nr:helix-turn-helix domain-containing protein [Leptospiraceae bacterium]
MFSKRLKELRLEKNLTQAELAGVLGLKPSIVGMYENGHRMPETKALAILADFFNVTTDYLLGRTSSKKQFIRENLKFLMGNRTTEDYAKQLKISPMLLARYEEGKETPQHSIIEYIADIENLDPAFFYTLSDNIENLRIECLLSGENQEKKEIKDWLNSTESKEYIEFIYKAYKKGLPKELLAGAEINIKFEVKE